MKTIKLLALLFIVILYVAAGATAYALVDCDYNVASMTLALLIGITINPVANWWMKHWKNGNSPYF